MKEAEIGLIGLGTMGAALVLLASAGLAHAAGPADTPLPFAGDTPLFQEEAEAAGIAHSYGGPWEFFVGGGGAALSGGAVCALLVCLFSGNNKQRQAGPVRIDGSVSTVLKVDWGVKYRCSENSIETPSCHGTPLLPPPPLPPRPSSPPPSPPTSLGSD